MREIKYLVVHCTATRPSASVQGILNYWKNVMKWKKPGYHFLVEANGRVHNLLPIEEVSNGVKGYNEESIHVSYVGGIDGQQKAADTRTAAQKSAMYRILFDLKKQFPHAIIQGHRDFPGVSKSCPSFDTKAWVKIIGL